MLTVWLAEQARHDIAAEACRHRVTETGGALFGYVADDGTVVIERATRPGPAARHRPTSFRPDRAAIQRDIEAVIAESDGRRYLVGEWHTHPLGPPRPSSRDCRSVASTAADVGVGLERPVLIIQSTVPWGRRVRAGEMTCWIWCPLNQTVNNCPVSVFHR
jgi:integrative and conjugative element protein (TIGR02256 family)